MGPGMGMEMGMGTGMGMSYLKDNFSSKSNLDDVGGHRHSNRFCNCEDAEEDVVGWR